MSTGSNPCARDKHGVRTHTAAQDSLRHLRARRSEQGPHVPARFRTANHPQGTRHEHLFKGYDTESFIHVARQASGKSRFAGAAYVVESASELERAAALRSATGSMQALEGAPGGKIVTLHDPTGHLVHLVHGWTEKPQEPTALEKLVVNFEDVKPRKGKFQCFKPGPAPVFRSGHYGVTIRRACIKACSTGTRKSSRSRRVILYTVGRSLLHASSTSIEARSTATTMPSFSKPGEEPCVAHVAFEVHDFDIRQLGHQPLVECGYELCWGVGRVSVSRRRYSCSAQLTVSSTSWAIRSLTIGLTPAASWWNTMLMAVWSITINQSQECKQDRKHSRSGDHPFPLSSSSRNRRGHRIRIRTGSSLIFRGLCDTCQDIQQNV